MGNLAPHGGDALGATPGHPLLTPALSLAPRTSLQQAMLDLQAIQRIPGLAGYWPADPAYMFEDSAGTIPASLSGVVGCVRNLLSAPVYTPVTITNSDFELGDDGSWTKGTGWTIGSGVATKSAGTASALAHSVSLVAGTTYLLTVTTSISAGWITPRLTGGTTNTSAAISTSGTSERTLVALTGNNVLDFYATDIFAGTVDNVTLVAVAKAPALQATTAVKPYLRKTPTSNVYWLDSNTTTSALTANLGNLGSACTVAGAGAEGVTFTEGVTISSPYNIAPAYGFNTDIAIFNRALTATEKALLTRYMQRYVPTLFGPNLIVNGTFDTDATGWIAYTGGVATVAAGVATLTNSTATVGKLGQSFTVVSGKSYKLAGTFSNPQGGSPGGQLYCGASPGGFERGYNVAAVGQVTLCVTTSSTINAVTVVAGTATLNAAISFDDITFQEIL